MQSKIQRWGNSLAVRIPRAFAKDVGIEEEAPVEILVREGDLVIKRIDPGPWTLDQLLAGVSDENLHDEVETGPAMGREVW